MTKEFVKYEIALELKELGFDEPCLAHYNSRESYNLKIEMYSYLSHDKFYISAPLYQQAFRWFREKHKLHSATFWMEIDKSIYWNYRYSYLNDKSTESVNRSMVYFNTPEEAELECLKKLIEIVKEQK